jgi:trimeric autotransporter adhesin
VKARLPLYVLIALSLLPQPARAQSNSPAGYIISTFAGTPVPPTPVPATSVAIFQPWGVAADPAGNIYIASQGLRAVFKLDSSAVLTRIAGNGVNGGGAPNNLAVDAPVVSPEGVAMDSSGNLYIANAGGIQRVAADGTIAFVFVSYIECAQELQRPSGLAVDASGNLYVGDEDTSQLMKITPAGVGTCLFSPSQPEGVAVDASGNLYVASPYEGLIWKISSSPGGGENIFAGNRTQGYSGDGGPATKASLNNPYGVAVDRSGNVYIADTYNYRIRKVTPAGIITTVAGNGTPGYSGDGGAGLHAQIDLAYGLAADSSGDLYFADNSAAAVRKISTSGTITTVAGGNKIGDGGLAAVAQLDFPNAVAKDTAGNLYIAEYEGNRIRRVAPNGTISTVAGTGVAGFSGDDGPATRAELNYPIGVAVDASGDLYIADSFNGRVRKVAASGTITTVAGTGGHGNLGDGIPAISAELSTIAGIALDASGNLYIADQGLTSDLPAPMPRIRKVGPDGTITTVAGNGTEGYSGDGGAATGAELNMPAGLAVDASGNLYIADYNNFRIRKVTSAGIITTVAGNGTEGYSGNGGPAISAQLFGPSAVAADIYGNLYVSDTCFIRRVTNGVITTVAGKQPCGYAGDGGPATGAELQPAGLVVDSNGGIYVADTGSNTIRLLVPGLTINQSPLPGGSTGTSYLQTLNATGGTQPYSWSLASGTLPPGLTLSAAGVISGIPTSSGAFNFTIRVTDAASATATLPFILSVSSGCTFAVSPGGQAFPASGGAGTISIAVRASCIWTASVGPAWVALKSPSSGMGIASVNYTVSANSGGDRSGILTVAGQSFVVEQSSASTAGLTLAGSMAQLASGGGWDTTLTLVNTGAATGEALLNFLGNDGSPLQLPFTFSQVPSPAGPLVAATLDQTLNANSLLVLDSQQAGNPSAQICSAQVLTGGNIGGFAIFKYTPTGQEAVVPLETRNAPSYVLAFDNTGVLGTGVAIANVATQAANIPVVIRDDTGAQIGTDTIKLPAQGHTSFMLTGNYANTKGKRGTMELDTPVSGQISVLGLRANGSALTTLPVLANVTTGGGSMAQVASGGGWQTTFTLVNTGTSPAQAQLSFFDDNGNPLSLGLTFVQSGAATTASTASQKIAAGATLLVVTQGSNAGASLVGSAQLTTSGTVSGFAIFRYNPTGQEAVVPLETRNAIAYVLAFDNTNGLATGVALANVSNQAANVPVVLRDDTGASLGTATLNLASRGHTSFVLKDSYASAAGKRGTVEFHTPAGVQISVLGLRATPTGAVTTIPVLAQ